MRQLLFIALLFMARGAFAESLPFSNSFCQTEIQKTIQQWGSLDQWSTVANHDPKDEVYQTPTSQIGIWVQIEKSKDGIHALRITSHTQVGLEWTEKKCTPDMKVATRNFFPQEGKDDFRDDDLATLVSKSGTGAILLWSPGMPYSLRSIESAREAAKKLKVPLTLVLDSNADRKQAEKAAASLHLKKEDFKNNRSVELIFRNAEIHFPVMLFYAHGKMTKQILPGLALEPLYEKYMQEQMK